MPGPPTDPEAAASPEDGETHGASASVGANFQTYLKARADLLSIESKEATRVVAKKSAFGVCLVAAAFFAYSLVLVAAVSLLGRWLAMKWPETFEQVGWQVAALALGLLHVMAVAILFALIRRKSSAPLFEYTRSEFQKDHEWLQHDQSENKSGS